MRDMKVGKEYRIRMRYEDTRPRDVSDPWRGYGVIVLFLHVRHEGERNDGLIFRGPYHLRYGMEECSEAWPAFSAMWAHPDEDIVIPRDSFSIGGAAPIKGILPHMRLAREPHIEEAEKSWGQAHRDHAMCYGQCDWKSMT